MQVNSRLDLLLTCLSLRFVFKLLLSCCLLLEIVLHVCNGVRVNDYFRDDKFIEWSICLVDRVLLYQVKGLEAINKMTEDSKLIVKRGMFRVCNEELRCVLVRSRVCHAQNASLIVSQLIAYFVLEWSPVYRLTTLASSSRVSCLHHEAPDISMDFCPDVVIRGAESKEIAAGHWRLFTCQLKL